MQHTADGWIDQYRKKDALWIHDGNPKRPHALLTSGKHSNGFFNSRLVIPDEALLRDAASDLLELFEKQGGNGAKVHGVVGPQTGATKLAELIAQQILALRRSSCFSVSPKKIETGAEKAMIFDDAERAQLPGQLMLLCDDVLTTSGSVGLTAKAVTDAGGFVMPFILVLVNRSGLTEARGKKIIALIDRPMPMWEPGDCPLCPQGSEAIRPKGVPEWIRLNAVY